MPRRENSIYEGEPIPRTRENERLCWEQQTLAKKHPKYVYGRIGFASLIHKVDRVAMRWYDFDYGFIYRLKHPKLIAHTRCGNLWRLESGRGGGTTCDIPAPDAEHCKMCAGEGRNFGKNGKSKATKRQAKDRLGCIAEGTQP